MKQFQIITIGAYGFTQETFFAALQWAKVDTFCDVRWRRGVRDSLYAFANSERLQNRLQEIGIRYLYRRDLAPNPSIRTIQEESDKAHHVLKRERERLEPRFIETNCNYFCSNAGACLSGSLVALACTGRRTLLSPTFRLGSLSSYSLEIDPL